jgi:anti-sigma-K factor RskA
MAPYYPRMAASDPHALVGPYALDALGDEEQRRFEDHLAGCEECREALATLREAAASLAYGAAGPAPPPALKERILTQARAERPNVRPLTRRRSWAAPVAAAAAVAAAVALAIGVWSATRPPAADPFAAVLAKPGAKVVRMNGRGVVAFAPDGTAALALAVPKAPAGKTYEAWVIRPNAIEPAGLFRGGKGASVVAISRRVPRGSAIGVTIERAGGVDQPTQKPFVASEATS